MHGTAAQLLQRGHGEANALALDYRAHLLDRGLAPATVNRRLSALRSLVKLARTIGEVPWTLDVENVRARAYRDTRGPDVAGFLALLAAAEGEKPKAVRDRAVISMLFNPGLRRGELVALDVADIECADGGPPVAVQVIDKGQHSADRIELPETTAATLAALELTRFRGHSITWER